MLTKKKDKSNTAVILSRNDHVCKINDFLSDNSATEITDPLYKL